MSWIKKVDRINQRVGDAVSLFILVIVAITIFEVLMRYGFNRPTIWVHETSSFLFSYAFLLGGAYTLQLRRHVAVDVLTRKLAPARRRLLEILMSVFFFFFIGLFIWKTGEWAWDSIVERERAHSVWEPYLFPVISAVPVAATLILLQGVVDFIRILRKEAREP